MNGHACLLAGRDSPTLSELPSVAIVSDVKAFLIHIRENPCNPWQKKL